jgi:hypothetical protein
MISGHFDVSDRASIVFQNSVHIEFAFAIWPKCVVMAVDQQGGSGHEPRIHGQGFRGIEPGVESSVEFDQYEALPAGAVAFGIGFQLLQEAFFELENFLDVHAANERVGSGDGGIGEQNVFEFVSGRRQDGGALVDFGGIEQVEHGEMLGGENFVHGFEAEAALAVEEIGDVGLLESGLLGEMQAAEFACFDALPEQLAEIILQGFEFHGGEYSTGVLRENPHPSASSGQAFSRTERARNGHYPAREANQTRDYCVAKNATHRAARADPSLRKERLVGMTSQLGHLGDFHRPCQCIQP